ncbi:hypothetical protein [Streptomyces sp900116325]|uniref:hypothetical protein n=1 Tax=Streptomyces sp. 900116325 TaxID=3154295 RepID=UPI0033F24BB5
MCCQPGGPLVVPRSRMDENGVLGCPVFAVDVVAVARNLQLGVLVLLAQPELRRRRPLQVVPEDVTTSDASPGIQGRARLRECANAQAQAHG